jgi:hypothetical protein
LVPALCQSSPYSPPPLRLGTQSIPPKLFRKTSLLGLNYGVTEMLNPPYPYSRVKMGFSGTVSMVGRVSFFLTINIGTLVPSFEVNQT